MLQDSKGGLHLQNSLLLKYLYIYQSHRSRLDNTHTVSKIKSYNSFRLLPHKLKLENIYFKIVSHAEGQKTWVKRSGLYTQFWWLFEQIILVVYTWWLLFFSYMRNKTIKDCMEKIWSNWVWKFFGEMEILEVTAHVCHFAVFPYKTIKLVYLPLL